MSKWDVGVLTKQWQKAQNKKKRGNNQCDWLFVWIPSVLPFFLFLGFQKTSMIMYYFGLILIWRLWFCAFNERLLWLFGPKKLRCLARGWMHRMKNWRFLIMVSVMLLIASIGNLVSVFVFMDPPDVWCNCVLIDIFIFCTCESFYILLFGIFSFAMIFWMFSLKNF